MKTLTQHVKRSLPTRLLLVFIVVCLCIIALLAVTLARGFGTQWEGGIRPHLNQYLSYVNQDIGNPPDFSRAEQLANSLPINIYIDGPKDYSSTGSPLDTGELEFYDERSRWNKRQEAREYLQSTNSNLSFGELNDRTVLRNQLGEYTVYFEVLHGNASAHGSGFIWRALLWLVVILALSYWLLRRMLKPVQDIKLGAQRMGSGELDYRVPVRADNDLGELAGSINHMAEDIEGMLDAKRQLLLALSHELRSPLTRAKIAVQMLEDSSTQQSIDDDLNEMQALISEILEAERMNGRHAALNRESVDPTALLANMVAEFAEIPIEQTVNGDLPKMPLDETRMKLMLRNLIGNAITYSKNAERAPQVCASLQENSLIIEVRDFGEGIAEEHLPRLTEPFYRADASRTRSTGGFGLGLHLCKLIAEAHGGVLTISSTLGEGSCMRVQLPIERTTR